MAVRIGSTVHFRQPGSDALDKLTRLTVLSLEPLSDLTTYHTLPDAAYATRTWAMAPWTAHDAMNNQTESHDRRGQADVVRYHLYHV